ncbi:MAG: HAD family hydrolase [Oscillospiraceae bacterium]|jgi:D-glycero-D-manno-heptose 1,7-bisphosphate phosphatase|nr:HAD family hydrolase [Oscillospiraceae bacterium]
MNKAAFFDRDGTININTGHTYKIEELKFISGRPELIKGYNDAGYLVIVVTNQAGIAKGLYTEDDMHRFNRHMNERLQGEYGAHIDAFYFCPHHPDVTGECNCRKPKPGMLRRAIEDFDIDVGASILFGDQAWDMQAAQACGIKNVLLDD